MALLLWHMIGSRRQSINIIMDLGTNGTTDGVGRVALVDPACHACKSVYAQLQRSLKHTDVRTWRNKRTSPPPPPACAGGQWCFSCINPSTNMDGTFLTIRQCIRHTRVSLMLAPSFFPFKCNIQTVHWLMIPSHLLLDSNYRPRPCRALIGITFLR